MVCVSRYRMPHGTIYCRSLCVCVSARAEVQFWKLVIFLVLQSSEQ